MYQNPVLQLQLAQELDRCKAVEQAAQKESQQVESVLDAIVRRLKQLISRRPLQPLARGAS